MSTTGDKTSCFSLTPIQYIRLGCLEQEVITRLLQNQLVLGYELRVHNLGGTGPVLGVLGLLVIHHRLLQSAGGAIASRGDRRLDEELGMASTLEGDEERGGLGNGSAASQEPVVLQDEVFVRRAGAIRDALTFLLGKYNAAKRRIDGERGRCRTCKSLYASVTEWLSCTKGGNGAHLGSTSRLASRQCSTPDRRGCACDKRR